MNNLIDELTPEEIAAGDVLMTSEVVPWHFPMMNDIVRNDAYEKALKSAFTTMEPFLILVQVLDYLP